jgi:enamine deaminase RidA (YjgF/YER057c/UK114 family)
MEARVRIKPMYCRHARSAVGCGSLPNNVTVEVEAIFEAE